MLKSLLVSALLVLTVTSAFASGEFPIGPDANLTPGELCHQPDSYRYREKIAYCVRDVSTYTKAEIFAQYDSIGFNTRSMKRKAFKIDHYIPLCAGGANTIENLWPQHESIYKITDALEAKICEKMGQGRLKQADAVTIVKHAKNHLEDVPALMSQLNNL